MTLLRYNYCFFHCSPLLSRACLILNLPPHHHLMVACVTGRPTPTINDLAHASRQKNDWTAYETSGSIFFHFQFVLPPAGSPFSSHVPHPPVRRRYGSIFFFLDHTNHPRVRSRLLEVVGGRHHRAHAIPQLSSRLLSGPPLALDAFLSSTGYQFPRLGRIAWVALSPISACNDNKPRTRRAASSLMGGQKSP